MLHNESAGHSHATNIWYTSTTAKFCLLMYLWL